MRTRAFFNARSRSLVISAARFAFAASAALAATGCRAPSPGAPAVEPLELVLQGGQVIDPESGLAAVRDVGIAGGRIVAVSEQPLTGGEVVAVSGLVVAPGFIDLHAHGQDPVSNRLQALDGVTTALECEIGVYPVAEWLRSRAGKAVVHYGATVGHLPARIKLFHGRDVLHTPTAPPDAEPLGERPDYAYRAADDGELDALLELLERGLDEGGLGLGLGITYTPAASRWEIHRLFELAAKRQVPVFVHVRAVEATGALGPIQEMIADAAATGASLHVVHLNSSTDEEARHALALLRGARERGLDVTTESYPYTAGSTRLESALFDAWENRPASDYQQLQWAATGERLTPETFRRYRRAGGWVIIHGRREETNEWLVAQPDVMVASDGIPFLYGPAHPRGAGTFARVLGHYVRERSALSLVDALRKMTILPARRLEAVAPQMRRKGRLAPGADADVTVFDAGAVLDRATYVAGDIPSSGIRHVLVGGVFVVRDGAALEGVFPGQAITAESAAPAAAASPHP